MPWNTGPNPLTQLPPKPASVFVRANRYALLVAGFVMGWKKHNHYMELEPPIQAMNHKLHLYLEEQNEMYNFKKTFYDERQLYMIFISDKPEDMPDTHIDFRKHYDSYKYDEKKLSKDYDADLPAEIAKA